MTGFAYKVLGPDGSAFHGGTGSWPLPKGDRPGEWIEVKPPIVACQRGLHLCRRQDLVRWLGPTIWEAEYDSEVVEQDDKIVVSRARLVRPLPWDDRSNRLFAADCAARSLRMQFRRVGIHPDPRSLGAVKVARRFAEGDATSGELSAARSAAWSAAWSARSAAWSAACSAESAACSAAAWSAESAARSAAWSARSAAWGARSAESAAERAWQTKRLFEYLDGKR